MFAERGPRVVTPCYDRSRFRMHRFRLSWSGNDGAGCRAKDMRKWMKVPARNSTRHLALPRYHQIRECQAPPDGRMVLEEPHHHGMRIRVRFVDPSELGERGAIRVRQP